MQLLDLAHAALGLGQQLARRRLEDLRRAHQPRVHLVHLVEERLTGDRLDAAHARGDGRLARDAERTDLRRVVHMRAAAKLNRPAAHVDHADDVAVFFAEQRNRAGLLCLFNRHLADVDVESREDLLADETAHLAQLFRRHGGEMREVITQPVFLDEGTRLMRMVAQHRPQRLIEQVRRGVRAHDGAAARLIDPRLDRVAHGEAAARDLAVVHELAALVLLHIEHGELCLQR